jgi:putative membrane protein
MSDRQNQQEAVRVQTWSRLGLAVFGAFTVAAIAGYAVFARHPELLAGRPAAMAVYSRAFTFFPRAHILIGAAALAVLLVGAVRWRWVASFAAVYVVSLSSELLGTTRGLPFGPYRYTAGLGIKWFGHVPVLIPLSWFLMALPSYAIARYLLGRSSSPARRVLLGSLILLSWDLSLDPAMSQLTSYWVWGSSGPYYGMPWLNLFGWYVTGVALMIALLWTRADEWVGALPVSWLALFYALNLALPFGLIAAGAEWGALAASVGALGVCWLVGRAARSRDSAPRMAVPAGGRAP